MDDFRERRMGELNFSWVYEITWKICGIICGYAFFLLSLWKIKLLRWLISLHWQHKQLRGIELGFTPYMGKSSVIEPSILNSQTKLRLSFGFSFFSPKASIWMLFFRTSKIRSEEPNCVVWQSHNYAQPNHCVTRAIFHSQPFKLMRPQLNLYWPYLILWNVNSPCYVKYTESYPFHTIFTRT